MYLDCEIKIPVVPGRINQIKKGKTTYVRYVLKRTYHADKKYNVPEQKVIGKRSETSSELMIPNENFIKYFADIELPVMKKGSTRSSCLRVGNYFVLRKIIEEYRLPGMLEKHLGKRDTGLFLDLAAYSIISENNAAQYYPDYAYNHPLFTEGMHIYSDSRISDFFSGMTDEQRTGFLNEWNEKRDHREKIYISYDSTNKNCQAGELEMVEFGHPKDNRELPVFNYSIAYDTDNREPLFYEQYPGSIVDVSQLQYMLEKAKGYGYKRAGFILDRGYFSKENIQYMDECGYDFVIMVRGMASFVKELVLENKGTFEMHREYGIRKYKAYGMTVKKQMYATDKKERYFHIFYSDQKAAAEREQTEGKIERMGRYLDRIKGKKVSIGEGYRQYFHLEIYEEDGTFLYAREKEKVIEEELSLCGYFVIVTSHKMTAKEAIELYKSRDSSEKLFRGDKSYLGNKSLRVQSDEAAFAKIFVEFVALIIRSRIYTMLKDEEENLEKRLNYMTVPAAIRELEKIEMVRQADGRYRLDHALTAVQKTILKAFQMDGNYIRKQTEELSCELERNINKEELEEDTDGKTEERTLH